MFSYPTKLLVGIRTEFQHIVTSSLSKLLLERVGIASFVPRSMHETATLHAFVILHWFSQHCRPCAHKSYGAYHHLIALRYTLYLADFFV